MCVILHRAKTQAGPDVRLINLLFSAKIAFCAVRDKTRTTAQLSSYMFVNRRS